MKNLRKSRYLWTLLLAATLSTQAIAKSPAEYKQNVLAINVADAFTQTGLTMPNDDSGQTLESLVTDEGTLLQYVDVVAKLNEQFAIINANLHNDAEKVLNFYSFTVANQVNQVKLYFNLLEKNIEVATLAEGINAVDNRIKAIKHIAQGLPAICDGIEAQMAQAFSLTQVVDLFEHAKTQHPSLNPKAALQNAGFTWIQSDINPLEQPQEWADDIKGQIKTQVDARVDAMIEDFKQRENLNELSDAQREQLQATYFPNERIEFVKEYTAKIKETTGKLLDIFHVLDQFTLDDPSKLERSDFLQRQKKWIDIFIGFEQRFTRVAVEQDNPVQRMIVYQGQVTMLYAQIEAYIEDMLIYLAKDEAVTDLDAILNGLYVNYSNDEL